MRLHALLALALVVVGCGSNPPPKVEEPTQDGTQHAARKSGPMPQMSQELGSIDQKKVEQTFASLMTGAIEACHKQARDRIEFLTGDVKVFLRIDGSGRVKYGFFEDSTMGDREAEKCILGVFSGTSWPKPEGGEAEVRSGFGWGPGGEREPTPWQSDKVTAALASASDVKKEVDKCKAGVKGDFRVTAYVEEGEGDHASSEGASEAKGKPAPKPASKPAKPAPQTKKGGKDKEAGGRFKAIGMSAPSKEGAEKIDCMVDALKHLELPSPGSYAAKVTFSL